jgi:hypothetical protein
MNGITEMANRAKAMTRRTIQGRHFTTNKPSFAFTVQEQEIEKFPTNFKWAQISSGKF